MKQAQAQVREFMIKAGQETPGHPTMPTQKVCNLRYELIREELMELNDAFENNDIVGAYDAVLDLLVVTIGTAVAMGIEIEPGWAEVHRSNMSKFIDGHRRADGKWVKGPSYSPAQLEGIIEAQHKA